MATSITDQFQTLIMNLNPGAVIGLDIGAHSVKVCELSGTPGKYKLEHFALVTLEEAAIIEDEFQRPQELVQAITKALSIAKIKSKTMCVGLFGPNTMTKRLSVPEGTKEEMEDHIMWESEQYITFGVDDAQIDFDIIGENEGGGKDALVVAARNDLISRVMNVVEEAKLKPKILDLNVLALSNLFEEIMAPEMEALSEGTIILDFGAQNTKVIVYRNGSPIFTKELPFGGGLITEEIQRQMSVSYEEAEDLKTASGGKGKLPQEVLDIIEAQLDLQLSELKKSLNFYITPGSAEKVEYCFVTGGSSLLPGLKERLAQMIGIHAEPLDPLRLIQGDPQKFNLESETLCALGSVVMGLAMRKN